MTLRLGTLALLALALTGGGLRAAPSDPARQDLLKKIWDVPGSTFHRFDARDHLGGRMEAVKIIANPEGRKEDSDLFLAIYQNDDSPVYGNGRRRVYLATSSDLQKWKMRSLQAGSSDYPASQPTIKAAPQGGFVVAWEQETAAGNSVHVRYYEDKFRLYNALPSRQHDCPQGLAGGMEGTPSITAITPTDVVLEFHSQQETPGAEGPTAVARLARGRLTNFFSDTGSSTWHSVTQQITDNAVLHWLKQEGSDVIGSVVDVDGISTYIRRKLGSKVRFSLVAGQLKLGDLGTSKVFLLDHDTFNADPVLLNVGSTSYGKPSVTTNLKLDGKKVTVVSMFIYPEGSLRGEAGQLIYYFPQN